jgi:hypothetical protein
VAVKEFLVEFPKLTRTQLIVAAVVLLLAVLASMKFTRWWHGEAIEVSLENAGATPIFVYLDNTGRHGSSTHTESLQTTDGRQTPSGLLVKAGQTRSLGPAVGLGDSPTLHTLPVDGNSRADSTMTSDCVFDTVSLQKLEIPARHIKLKWTGKECEIIR